MTQKNFPKLKKSKAQNHVVYIYTKHNGQNTIRHTAVDTTSIIISIGLMFMLTTKISLPP